MACLFLTAMPNPWCHMFSETQNALNNRNIFYRTQVSLGSGLWFPVYLQDLFETLLMWLWLWQTTTACMMAKVDRFLAGDRAPKVMRPETWTMMLVRRSSGIRYIVFFFSIFILSNLPLSHPSKLVLLWYKSFTGRKGAGELEVGQHIKALNRFPKNRFNRLNRWSNRIIKIFCQSI